MPIEMLDFNVDGVHLMLYGYASTRLAAHQEADYASIAITVRLPVAVGGGGGTGWWWQQLEGGGGIK